MTHTYTSYAAIGDSFSEGVGDERPDGTPRGWADLVAQGLAATTDQPVTAFLTNHWADLRLDALTVLAVVDELPLDDGTQRLQLG